MMSWKQTGISKKHCDCGGKCCESSHRNPRTSLGQFSNHFYDGRAESDNLVTRVAFDPKIFRSNHNFVGNHAEKDAQLHGHWNPFGVQVNSATKPLYGQPGDRAVPAEYQSPRVHTL